MNYIASDDGGNTDDNYNSEALELKNKVNDYHVTFVCEDEKGTSNTSDNDNYCTIKIS